MRLTFQRCANICEKNFNDSCQNSNDEDKNEDVDNDDETRFSSLDISKKKTCFGHG